MKKVLLVICVLILAFAVSCTAADRKLLSQHHTYKDPQMIGGYWDVTMQTGQTFKHVKCTYWGTDDDTAVFQMDDGRIICQSGACVCVYAGEK